MALEQGTEAGQEAKGPHLAAPLPGVTAKAAPGIETWSFSGRESKKLFHQLPDGGFEECAFAEGFASRADGRSLVAVDLDNDGDQDLVLINRAEPRVQVFRNDSQQGNALRLKLRGVRINRDAAGAKVYVRDAAGGTRVFPVVLARGFSSGVDPAVHVGLGTASEARVTVEWAPSRSQELGLLQAGFIYAVTEDVPEVARVPFRKRSP